MSWELAEVRPAQWFQRPTAAWKREVKKLPRSCCSADHVRTYADQITGPDLTGLAHSEGLCKCFHARAKLYLPERSFTRGAAALSAGCGQVRIHCSSAALAEAVAGSSLLRMQGPVNPHVIALNVLELSLAIAPCASFHLPHGHRR